MISKGKAKSLRFVARAFGLRYFRLWLAILVAFFQPSQGFCKQQSANTDYANPATSKVNWTPVLMNVVTPIQRFQGSDHKYNLVYDVVLHNYSNETPAIEEFAILDPKHPERELLKLKGQSLKEVFSSLTKHNDCSLSPGESGVVWVNLNFDKAEDVAQKLVHKLRVNSKSQLGDPTIYEYSGAEISASLKDPVLISPPLKGKHWVAEGGYCGKLGHRRALFPVNNQLMAAQTYAIDWEKLDDQNYTLKGDPHKPESYFTYGQPVFAVADGTVYGVIDKFQNQVPGSANGKEILSHPAGNSITLDIGNGHYVLYAHLKPKSIRVKEGERVKTGQQIAEVGNTGNSSGPHLHMHISNGPSPIVSQGVPYVFESFVQEGEIADMSVYEDSFCSGKAQAVARSQFDGAHRKELVKEGAIVSFP